ncbi:MAG: efflux RND transporter permease subunit [Acidobacteriota bacterium]|nr:efflux RND transporter permease subunit [Acidobacteriota bacterium]
MFISDFAIKRPIITVVSMIALVVFGLFALIQLDTDEFPEVDPPIISVSIPYPGASPDQVEREIVEPIEEAVAGLSGINKITSSSLDSFATLQIEFVFEKDLREATQEIRDEINAIRNDLPVEMEEPILVQFDPTEFPIVSLALASETVGAPELTLLADPQITRELRSLTGVGDVTISGNRDREVEVGVRPEALQAAGISVGEVVGALRSQNLAVPVGRINTNAEERTIRLRGRVETVEDFRTLVVTNRGGRLVRLGDVADVRIGTEEPRTSAMFSGRESVGIDIIKAKGYSTTAVAEAVREKVDAIRPTLPQGVTLELIRDAGTRVENSVRNVQEALLEGAILTVLTVFLFLNSWRSTVITGLALPVSVLAAFVAVWAWGFTLNTMSLLGLSLAIGILIDDAIVVRENIVRHVELGKDHFTAAHDGTDEIGLAVAATTLSIVVVFVPMAFMGGIAEQWFAPFALTIACAVLVSLFVSFSLDPMLSAYWPDPDLKEHERYWISRKLAGFNRWFDRQADRYKRVIGWALRHRLAMIALALATFIGALALPAMGFIGGGFFPVQDVSEFMVNIETPPGSSLEYTTKKTEEVAAVARTKPEVAYTYATVGGRTGAVDEGIIYVRLTPKADRDRHQHTVSNELRQEFSRIGGVTASISSGDFENQKQIQLQIQGPDSNTLVELAEKLAVEVRTVPGAVDVGLSTGGQKPEFDVRLDRPLAGSVGLTVADIAQVLRPAFAGIDAGDWVDPTGKTRDVTVRLAAESRSRVTDLESLPLVVRDAQGQPVTLPLGQVASITPSLGPAQIDHLDRDRVVSVQANTQGRPLTEVLADIEVKLAAMPFPPGYSLRQGGETEEQQEVFGRILSAMGLALMLMYFVLVVQFGSFLDPIAILVSLPLSLIGVMLALLFTGSTLNIMSMIGIILLMGIVAKNAILLIDFAKWSEEKGMPRREAIIEAGRARLRPILMTTFALIAGMIPVALGTGEGADFRAPMGRAIIGGVITSTVLTLLVIPTVYDILCGFRERMGRMFGRSGQKHRADHVVGT